MLRSSFEFAMARRLQNSIFFFAAMLLITNASPGQLTTETLPITVPRLRSTASVPTVCRADGAADGQTLKTANVSVFERKTGRGLSALSIHDFKIFENGLEREIARVALSRGPLSVSLVVDTSPSRTAQLSQVARAAQTIVGGLAPTDRFSLITFDGEINQLITAKRVSDLSGRDIQIARTGYGTRLYDAVDAALRTNFGSDAGRKVVILFTDGRENSSKLAGSDVTIARARESDITIYSIQYPYEGILEADHYLRTLSDLTGGKVFVSGVEDSARNLASILDDVAGRYTICYWSPDPKPQAIAVKLSPRDVAYAIKLHAK